MNGEGMSEEQFWGIIEAAKTDSQDCRSQAALIQRRLAEMPPKSISAFGLTLEAKTLESDKLELWGAAQLLNHSMTEDMFESFKGWLISRGRKVYGSALRDPDSLAGFPEVKQNKNGIWNYLCDDILDVHYRAYEEVTGEELILDPEEADWGGVSPSDVSVFQDVEVLQERYPRLWELIGYDDPRTR